MKRFIIIAMLALSALCCWAANSHLASERIFSRKDIRIEGVSIMSKTDDMSYYRSIQADGNKKLMEEIRALVEEDKKRASSVVTGFYDGQDYEVLSIPHNGHVVSVGFYWRENGEFNFFISGDPASFK